MHKKISYWKSVIRIAGFYTWLFLPGIAITLLIFAEILGIAEEWDE